MPLIHSCLLHRFSFSYWRRTDEHSDWWMILNDLIVEMTTKQLKSPTWEDEACWYVVGNVEFVSSLYLHAGANCSSQTALLTADRIKSVFSVWRLSVSVSSSFCVTLVVFVSMQTDEQRSSLISDADEAALPFYFDSTIEFRSQIIHSFKKMFCTIKVDVTFVFVFFDSQVTSSKNSSNSHKWVL